MIIKVGIMSYLNKVLKDPDSLKDLEWEETLTDGNKYKVRTFFRAKNSWGAYGISRFIFETSSKDK